MFLTPPDKGKLSIIFKFQLWDLRGPSGMKHPRVPNKGSSYAGLGILSPTVAEGSLSQLCLNLFESYPSGRAARGGTKFNIPIC